jgi:hypothetical protein
MPSTTIRHGWFGTQVAVALAVLLVGGHASGADLPDGVSLRAVVDSTSVYANDPLVLKCVLRNEGKQAITLFGPFDPRFGGVRIEGLPPGAKEFKPLSALEEEGGHFVRPKRWPLEPGQAVVCYARVFGGMATAGKWQVRIRVKINDKEVTSPVVTLTLAERPEKHRNILTESFSDIYGCVLRGVDCEPEDFRKAVELKDVFGDSPVGREIAQVQVLHALDNAGSARARALVLEDVQKHRTKLGLVAREYFDLATASVLIGHKEYDKAKSLLEGIPDPSHRQATLLATILADQPKKQKK